MRGLIPRLARRRGAGLLAAWLSAAGLTACSTQDAVPPLAALDVEASYELRYNDSLVGRALFVLQVDDGGAYLLEAFTVPAGKMARQDKHEVLESSRGQLDRGGVQPHRFDASVLLDGGLQAQRLQFDWPGRRLTFVDGDERIQIALHPGTQDRLSYLLLARRLARAGSGAMALRIASPGQTENTHLTVHGSAPLEVPAGRFDGIGIRRAGTLAAENRTLWFDPAACPLPLSVVHETDNSRVEMLLERCSPAGQRG